jgi:hypothetical protein
VTALAPSPPSTRWECAPDVLFCQYGHAVLMRKAGVVAKARTSNAVLFFICTRCATEPQGKTYFMADVYAGEWGAIARCYAIREADFRYWTGPAVYVPLDGGTLELLHHLGYAPHFRGAPTPHLPFPRPPRVAR